MAVELNHTIVPARDKAKAAKFLADILGLKVEPNWGPFAPVKVGGVTFDFDERDEVTPIHYAFLVDDKAFDDAFARIRDRRIDYFADPFCKRKGEVNRHYGGRGFYFRDPSGHLLELITKPYGEAPVM